MLDFDMKTGKVAQLEARNVSVIEDLGRVKYIFCDKTCTLTQPDGKMLFCEMAVLPSKIHPKSATFEAGPNGDSG